MLGRTDWFQGLFLSSLSSTGWSRQTHLSLPLSPELHISGFQARPPPPPPPPAPDPACWVQSASFRFSVSPDIGSSRQDRTADRLPSKPGVSFFKCYAEGPLIPGTQEGGGIDLASSPSLKEMVLSTLGGLGNCLDAQPGVSVSRQARLPAYLGSTFEKGSRHCLGSGGGGGGIPSPSSPGALLVQKRRCPGVGRDLPPSSAPNLFKCPVDGRPSSPP